MKFSYRIEDGMTVLCIDDVDMYFPETEKDRHITMSALRTEAHRLSRLITGERKTEVRNNLSECLSAATELVSLLEKGEQFRLVPIYRHVLKCALAGETKHRKSARRIMREINAVPRHSSIELGGIFDFADLQIGANP